MRRRLMYALLAAMLSTAGASWHHSPAVGESESRDDQYATGTVEDGDAVVEVGDSERPRPPRSGGGGGGGDVRCRYYGTTMGDLVDFSDLARMYEEAGRPLLIERWCEDISTGEFVSIRPIEWTPRTVVEDPVALARVAKTRLPLASPTWRSYPTAEHVVNLNSWLWVDEWTATARSATAGGVSATVTATPVRQRWVFGDGATRTCDGPGTPFDPGRRVADQPAPSCSYTFRRSSAGQPSGKFRGSVTMTWQVSWTSNVGEGGNLGELSRTAPVEFRVGEVQAVNR